MLFVYVHPHERVMQLSVLHVYVTKKKQLWASCRGTVKHKHIKWMTILGLHKAQDTVSFYIPREPQPYVYLRPLGLSKPKGPKT